MKKLIILRFTIILFTQTSTSVRPTRTLAMQIKFAWIYRVDSAATVVSASRSIPSPTPARTSTSVKWTITSAPSRSDATIRLEVIAAYERRAVERATHLIWKRRNAMVRKKMKKKSSTNWILQNQFSPTNFYSRQFSSLFRFPLLPQTTMNVRSAPTTALTRTTSVTIRRVSETEELFRKER